MTTGGDDNRREQRVTSLRRSLFPLFVIFRSLLVPPLVTFAVRYLRRSLVGPALRHFRGNFAVNTLPTPGVLSTVKSPPIARAKPRLIARPSPVPSY